MKKLLVLDNDGTLSEFKNGNFGNTIGADLTNNIKNYVMEILKISELDFNNVVKDIKERSLQLSQGFEELGINRKEYFYNTWKSLYPSEYIIGRENQNLKNLIKDISYYKVMLTGAPKIWFERTMSFLGYPISFFVEVYTAEDFYNKEEIFLQLFDSGKYNFNNSLAIGDEKNDYVYMSKLGGTGIDINKCKIYK